MENESLVFSIFLIFTGAALLATAALLARQAMLVAYIALGILLGPWGLGWVSDAALLQEISHVGIIMLLFLLGLNLHPQKLVEMLREATLVTLASSLLFAMVGAGVGLVLGFTAAESLVLGAALMFSSTIIGLKLLPTTVLHHQHTGEIIISILLLQDLVAIVVLLLLQGLAGGGDPIRDIALLLLLVLPGLVALAFVLERYLIIALVRRFDAIHEYVFLVAIGWCLGIAELARWSGLSQEIGAFIAGVALAANPISMFIAENLKPLRDFFLVLFFFCLGATFDLATAGPLLPSALVLGVLVIAGKPPVFGLLVQSMGEAKKLSWEVGLRLGQISEFSLLISFVARESEVIGDKLAYLIQLTTLLTFVASSYAIVMSYPTPMGVSARLRRD